MVTVPACWPGSTIAIVAAGPSLVEADVAYLRGRCRVIAVNDGVRLAPWADVLYASDEAWWKVRGGVPEFRGLKYGIRRRSGTARPFVGLEAVQVLQATGAEGLEPARTGLRHGNNSGYAAINLAVHLGAVRVLLLGFTYGRIDARVHFFGRHVAPLADPPDWLYATWRRLAASLVAPLARAGVVVLNCDPASLLEAFPRADLRAALPADASVAA